MYTYRIHDLSVSPGDDVSRRAHPTHMPHRHARDSRHGPRSSSTRLMSAHMLLYTRHASTHMMSHSIHTHAHRETRAHMRHISHGAPAMPLPRVGCGLCTWSTWEASSTPPPLKPPLHVGLPRTLPGLILPVAGDATETSIGHTAAVSRDGSRSTNWRC